MSQHFRFLDLPLEIRERTYQYALSLSFYDKAHKARLAKRTAAALRQCNVLLMNRQTSQEAQSRIASTPITLSYGLELEEPVDLMFDHENPGLESVQNFFPPSRLRETKQLTISDAGFREVKRNALTKEHFFGLSRLLRNVAEICREGHMLQSIYISFRSQLVKEYIDQLATSEDAQVWMYEVINSLREIRGIGKGRVTLDLEIQHPDTTKQQLISTMESPHHGLLSLPKHLRQKIYSYALDFNDATKQLREDSMASLTLTTPTMLLLNRQISAEVMPCIREVPLKISANPSQEFFGLGDCISTDTLRHIKHISVHVQRANHLVSIAKELVRSWTMGMATSFCPHLVSFELHYHEPGLRRYCLERLEAYPPPDIAEAMELLGKVRMVQEVKITGTLPRCYTDAIRYNMMRDLSDQPPRTPRFLENGMNTSWNYEDYESDSEWEWDEEDGAPQTVREWDERTFRGEWMPDYFWTEEFEEERSEEIRLELEYEDRYLSDAQLRFPRNEQDWGEH
jgi:hypothetical protein